MGEMTFIEWLNEINHGEDRINRMIMILRTPITVVMPRHPCSCAECKEDWDKCICLQNYNPPPRYKLYK